LSYAKAIDREPCEGRQASPSNPTKGNGKSAKRELNAVVVFRCTAVEKQTLIEKAKRSGRPFADLMREALGLADSRRRKPVPRVDPDLIRSVSRIGSNVNQIARWLNASTAAGHTKDIDAVLVAAQLVALDRSLNVLIESLATPSQAGDGRC
jgi:hypothetical protein